VSNKEATGVSSISDLQPIVLAAFVLTTNPPCAVIKVAAPFLHSSI